MKRVRKPAPESGTSFKPQQSQFASRPFAPKAVEPEAPVGESRVRFSLADIDIFPRETVQPKLRLGPVGDRYEQEQVKPVPNRTGMPDRLKAGIESLSGIDMSDVRVHANSPKPARLNALAYTQGNQIHLGPGQEKHLPHEAWHAVQQKQGRVRPKIQENGIAMNNDHSLERDADVMGLRAEVPTLTGAHCFTKSMKSVDVNDNAGLEGEANAIGGWAAQLEPVSKSSLAAFSPSAVRQLFAVHPVAPPLAGQRGRTLIGGVPTESHVTTKHGALNDLAGSPPGANILGWQHILNVGASGPWVRFHLVNENVGGLGNQDNLVPTSHATNHCPPWNSFESRIKYLNNSQIGIHVTVDVAYPPPIVGAVPGTLASVSHYYPNNISARVYYWSPATNTYILDPNQPNFPPFPLQPPAVAGVTNLAQQTMGWVGVTLMSGHLTDGQANIFWNALHNGTVDQYRNESNEPTPEMQLLDALDRVGEIDCMTRGVVGGGGGRKKRRAGEIPGHRVPVGSRIQVLNGVYILP
jgi:hypothetical protein